MAHTVTLGEKYLFLLGKYFGYFQFHLPESKGHGQRKASLVLVVVVVEPGGCVDKILHNLSRAEENFKTKSQ